MSLYLPQHGRSDVRCGTTPPARARRCRRRTGRRRCCSTTGATSSARARHPSRPDQQRQLDDERHRSHLTYPARQLQALHRAVYDRGILAEGDLPTRGRRLRTSPNSPLWAAMIAASVLPSGVGRVSVPATTVVAKPRSPALRLRPHRHRSRSACRRRRAGRCRPRAASPLDVGRLEYVGARSSRSRPHRARARAPRRSGSRANPPVADRLRRRRAVRKRPGCSGSARGPHQPGDALDDGVAVVRLVARARTCLPARRRPVVRLPSRRPP